MKAVHIYPIGAGPTHGPLSYFTSKEVAVGDTVQIAIRGRKVLGIVDSIEDITTDKSTIKKSPFQLKKIDTVLGQTLHGGARYKTAKLLARYYLSHPGLVLSTITPAIFADPILEKLPASPAALISPVVISPTLIQTSKNDRIVYFKKLIREYFAKKESIAIMLPTIHEAKEWRDVLAKGITEHTIFFTGDENKKAQKELVARAAAATHPQLLIGTFFAAILPVKKLGALIVEHESSNLYENRRRPLIDKRHAAEVYAYMIGAALYFSDSMLSLKTSGRLRLGTATALQKISFRLPHKSVDVVDMTTKRNDHSAFQTFTPQVLAEIQNTILNGDRVFVFAYRKNYASTTVCKDCGEGVTCPKCGHALALLSDTERLFFCPRCDENKSPDITCTRCGSWNLIPLGVGIDRAKEELSGIELGTTIARIDGRQKENEMDAAAKDFIDRKKKILLGTEAALSRLPENIDLSVVASLDSLFAMPLYHAPERAVQLMMRLAELSKRVIVETRYANELVFEGVKRGTFQEFADNEWTVREGLGYPPYRRLINLSFTGTKGSIDGAIKKLEVIFDDYRPEFFEMPGDRGRINARMQMKIEPELWPLIPLNPNDTLDEDLYSRLSSLPIAIRVDIE